MNSMDPKLGRPIEILLVEDSPSDTDLTVEALGAGKVGGRLRAQGTERGVEDGGGGRGAHVPQVPVGLLGAHV